MASVNRIKKTNTQVPKNLKEVNSLLGKIGNTQDEINELEKELKVKIDKLKASAAKKISPLIVRRDNQINSLFAFASPRKAELTEKVRSIVLGFGTFGWRLTTPRVEVTGTDEEMIATLEKTGYEDYVRIIKEIDRQELLLDRPIVKGISYVQSDEFFVIPKQKAKKAKTFTRAIDRENGK